MSNRTGWLTLADALNTSRFNTHTLTQQSAASLMTRREKKYLCSYLQAAELLEQLVNDYTLLTINQQRLCTYQSLYFDDDDFSFYLKHHNGQLPRKKVRIRKYSSNDTQFIEIKEKNNKRIVSKWRQQTGLAQSLFDQPCNDNSIKKLSKNSLKPVLLVSYQRVTLMNHSRDERVTFDIDISFQRFNSTTRYQLNDKAVVEIKTNKPFASSLCHAALRHMQIQPSSFSKYCIGLAATKAGEIKSNVFKSTINQLSLSMTHVNHCRQRHPTHLGFQSDRLMDHASC